MTLLSLYDMLPHSISQPPDGPEPMELDEALDPDTVKHILEILRSRNVAASSSSHSDDNSIRLPHTRLGGHSAPNDGRRRAADSAKRPEAVTQTRDDDGSSDRARGQLRKDYSRCIGP